MLEHAVAYQSATLHLKACGMLEAVQTAIWGKDCPWITNPALALQGAKDATADANGLGPPQNRPGRPLRDSCIHACDLYPPFLVLAAWAIVSTRVTARVLGLS